MEKKKRKGFGKKIVLTVGCGLLCGAIAAGVPAGISYYNYVQEKKTEEENKKLEEDSLKVEENGLAESQTEEARESSVYDVSVVWDSVSPSMVEIDTKYVSSYRFFGHTYEQESEGSGTGIIIAQADELFVVTNHHVVDGANAIQITFVDGTTAPAQLKGSNAQEDIAVLAVRFSDLSEDTVQRIRVATGEIPTRSWAVRWSLPSEMPQETGSL